MDEVFNLLYGLSGWSLWGLYSLLNNWGYFLMSQDHSKIEDRPPVTVELAWGVAGKFAHSLKDPKLSGLLLGDRDAMAMMMGYFMCMLEQGMTVKDMFRRAYTLLIDHLETELEESDQDQLKQSKQSKQ